MRLTSQMGTPLGYDTSRPTSIKSKQLRTSNNYEGDENLFINRKDIMFVTRRNMIGKMKQWE